MRVLVLCTGRCGSTTFQRACSHFTNYTSGHETRTARLGEARLAYPDHHIECDNRLSWLLGRLDSAFGDDAYYVHLTRDKEAVAQSYAKRVKYDGAIMPAYAKAILMGGMRKNKDTDMIEFARDYVDTVTANITHFLRDKSNVMQIDIETVKQSFPQFCDWIDAKGDLEAAGAEFDVRHNASG